MTPVKKAAFALAVVGLALLLLEGGARLAGEPPGFLTSGSVTARLYREKLVNRWILAAWHMRQNECSVYQGDVLGGRATPHMAGEVPVNALGLRDTALASPPPAAQRRILVLGDSSIFGVGLCRLETLPELLEAMANKGQPALKSGGRAVEVINAGVPGYSSYQSLEQLGRLLEQGVRPDVVVIYNMISDFAGPARLDDDHWFGIWAPVARVLGRAALVRWGDSLAAGVLDRRRGREEHDANAYHDHNRVSLSTYMENLRTMIRRIRQAGAWAMLVIPPLHQDIRPRPGHKTDLPDGFSIRSRSEAAPHERHIRRRMEELRGGARASAVNEDYRSAMALVAWEMKAPLLDGSGVIKQAARLHGPGSALEQRQPSSLMLDDVHPAPAGNRALAEALFPRIRKLLVKSR